MLHGRRGARGGAGWAGRWCSSPSPRAIATRPSRRYEVGYVNAAAALEAQMAPGRGPHLRAAAGVLRRRGPRRRAAVRPRRAAGRLPAPPPARGADHRRRERAARERARGPDALDYSLRLLAELRWTGLAMVEFRVGPAGRCSWRSTAASGARCRWPCKSGVDFPAGWPSCTSGAAWTGGRGRRARRIGRALAQPRASSSCGSPPCCAAGAATPSFPRPAAADGALGCAAAPHPADGFDVLCQDDPRPGLAELAGVTAASRERRHAT